MFNCLACERQVSDLNTTSCRNATTINNPRVTSARSLSERCFVPVTDLSMPDGMSGPRFCSRRVFVLSPALRYVSRGLCVIVLNLTPHPAIREPPKHHTAPLKHHCNAGETAAGGGGGGRGLVLSLPGGDDI